MQSPWNGHVGSSDDKKEEERLFTNTAPNRVLIVNTTNTKHELTPTSADFRRQKFCVLAREIKPRCHTRVAVVNGKHKADKLQAPNTANYEIKMQSTQNGQEGSFDDKEEGGA